MRTDPTADQRSFVVYEAMAGQRVWNFWRLRRIELPAAWACRHERVVVAFMRYSRTNWHAHLVGDDGDVLLSFPWMDHADRILLGEDDSEELPVVATDEEWWGVEQGWWAWVKADGNDVFVAEWDHDALLFTRLTPRIELVRPGLALADGVEVLWSCVDRSAYDTAWQEAIAACRQGMPSPVCEWESTEGPDGYRRIRLRA